MNILKLYFNDSQLDVTYFTKSNTTKLRPAMIFIHGGSWKLGDKKQFYRQAAYLAVLFNGHFDMNDQLKDHVQDKDMHTFFGGDPWEIPEVYGAASPFLRVSKDVPPMLFLHGDNDHYPHRQSVAMDERLR